MAIPIVVILLASIGYLWNQIPTELSPLEDRSYISINMRGPEGTTFEYIRDYADRIEFLADSMVPEKEAIVTRSWNGGGSLNVYLPDINKRERSQMEIAEQLTQRVRTETKARAFVQQQSTFGGRRGGCLYNMCYRRRIWRN